MAFDQVRKQRGAGSIGCLIMIAFLAAVMYAGYQFGLPKLRHSSFSDRMTETFAVGAQQKSEAEIQKQIVQLASEFDIALTPAQVKVDLSRARLKIDISYQKVIDLIVWQKTVTYSFHRDPAP